DDVMHFVEMMHVTDHQVTLTGCIARPRDLSRMPVVRFDLEALDAVVGPEHAFREGPEPLVRSFTHKPSLKECACGASGPLSGEAGPARRSLSCAGRASTKRGGPRGKAAFPRVKRVGATASAMAPIRLPALN